MSEIRRQEVLGGSRGDGYAATGAAIANRVGAAGIVPMNPLHHVVRMSPDPGRYAGGIAPLGYFIKRQEPLPASRMRSLDCQIAQILRPLAPPLMINA